ncbi:MAG TPA: FlgD immunoglobulin-like domain containing protein [bacterium]|nr:FlgD immunoglobulin-like domain containing protein [bacterium]
MKPLSMTKVALLLAIGLLGIGFMTAPCFASYNFQFTTYDYAQEVGQGAVATFTTYIQNTGTQADTIRLSISASLPAMWSADLCFRGKCIGPGVVGKMYLTPGQLDSLTVDFFTGFTQNMGKVTLTGTMKSAPGVSHTEIYATWTELPSILLVDDDDDNNYQTYLVNALAANGYPVQVWDTTLLGVPNQVRLKSYWIVFWTTASSDAYSISSGVETDLAAFLDAGGKLFLGSAGYLSSRSGATDFTANYLHIASWTNDTGGSPANGVTGDAISDGMTLPLTGGPLPTSISDSFVLDAGTDSVFTFTTGTCGLKVAENNHQVVFLSFPFENVSTTALAPNNQNALIGRIMAWFNPPVAGVEKPGARAGLVLRQNSPNPFSGGTTISFSVPGGSRDARIAIYTVAGQVVKTLLDGPVGSSETSVVWDGRDARGASVAPGLYFCKLTAGSESVLKKMVVAK